MQMHYYSCRIHENLDFATSANTPQSGCLMLFWIEHTIRQAINLKSHELEMLSSNLNKRRKKVRFFSPYYIQVGGKSEIFSHKKKKKNSPYTSGGKKWKIKKKFPIYKWGEKVENKEKIPHIQVGGKSEIFSHKL